MRIKSKLLTNSIISLVGLMLIGGIFLYSINLVNSENNKNELVNQISKNVLELNLLSNEHTKDYSDRTSEQWLLKHDSNSKLFQSDIFNKDEVVLFNNIREEHEDSKELFLQLSSENADELNDRILGQLSIKFKFMASESLRLSDLLREEIEKTQRNLLFAVLFLTVTLVGAGLFFSYKIGRSILAPISYIMQGTKEIERGNYKARVTINSGDEVEDLGNSFNKTMEALENIDSKRQELEHAKTEFLSVTSHELRSPMTPMKAQLQMLKDEYFGKLTPKQYTSIDIVLRNTERLDKIIMDLLEVSRIEAARLKFNFVNTNIGEHIRRIIEEMSGFIIEKNIQLIPKLEKIPPFKCDPDRIMQVLRNLLENAIKFSEKNNRIIINAKKSGDYVLFSVKDFGIGISDKAKKRLFEPFFQGEETIYRKYGGTGLGLSICKGIVESQGGRIWYESEVGKGTEFFFTFPMKPVKNIKPIKLMFSASVDSEYKALKILKEFLGPIAVREIEKLKKQELNYDRLLKYGDNLRAKKIINENQLLDYKTKLKEVYGKTEKPEVAKLMEIAKERKEMQDVIQKIILLAYKIYGEIAIRKANAVQGLKVDYNGKVIGMERDENTILRGLGVIYIDIMGDVTRFLKTKEALNNRKLSINKKR